MRRFIVASLIPFTFWSGYGQGGNAVPAIVPTNVQFAGGTDFNSHVTVRDQFVLQLGGSGSVNSSYGGLSSRNEDTPDTNILYTGTLSNSWLIASFANVTFDFAVPQQTNPTLVITSATQSTQQRIGIRHNQTQGQIVDLATTAASARPIALMGGADVASAGTITPTGNVFHVTGTTNIDSMTIMAKGSTVTLIFDGILTVGDLTGNINIGAAFSSTANDTLTLVADTTNWLEIGRSVN